MTWIIFYQLNIFLILLKIVINLQKTLNQIYNLILKLNMILKRLSKSVVKYQEKKCFLNQKKIILEFFFPLSICIYKIS